MNLPMSKRFAVIDLHPDEESQGLHDQVETTFKTFDEALKWAVALPDGVTLLVDGQAATLFLQSVAGVRRLAGKPTFKTFCGGAILSIRARLRAAHADDQPDPRNC